MELAGRRVLVTGASRGIGEALAERFAAAGARVALVARSEGPLKDLAARLGGTAHPADLADPEQVSTLIDQVEADGGPVDVLVNNAGQAWPIELDTLTTTDFDQPLAVNLRSAFLVTQAFLPAMRLRNWSQSARDRSKARWSSACAGSAAASPSLGPRLLRPFAARRR